MSEEQDWCTVVEQNLKVAFQVVQSEAFHGHQPEHSLWRRFVGAAEPGDGVHEAVVEVRRPPQPLLWIPRQRRRPSPSPSSTSAVAHPLHPFKHLDPIGCSPVLARSSKLSSSLTSSII